MSLLKTLLAKTRWRDIQGQKNSYRLLCCEEYCSASGANLKDGRLLTTSIHGTSRHSQKLSKYDMAFVTVMFLRSLSDNELNTICNLYNNDSDDLLLKTRLDVEKFED